MTLPQRKRLPFDLPPRAVYELPIELKEYAVMMELDKTSLEAAELLEQAWMDNKYELDNDAVFSIGIIHRWGLTATEAKSIEDVSKYIRQVTAQVYELIDAICEATGKGVEEVQEAIEDLQSTKYLPPFIRPYLDQILELKDNTPSYQERLSTIHLQRTIPAWRDDHTRCLPRGIVDGLIKFAMLEEGINPDGDAKKSEPGSN